jgi:peroxiredoxin
MKSRKQLKKQAQRQNIIMLVVGAGLMLVAVAAFLALPQATQTVSSKGLGLVPVPVEFEAPEVAITDLDGNPVSLADYRGQVVLYNAWATWCPPCKEEMPVLQAYYNDHKDQGFVIIAIEDGQPVDEVRAFVQSYGLTFPVWPDLEWKATTAFKIENLPTSYVIDRNGIARMTWTGAVTRETLEKYVTPLIEGN